MTVRHESALVDPQCGIMGDDDIAIVGFSFKLPQGIEDVSSLWDTLQNKRNLMTEWPPSRLKLESFYDADIDQPNKLHSRGAHFIDQDPGVFDAPFFSITTKEAAAMDPMQRWALETSYHAFENAGIPVQDLRGSRVGVFGASMTDDYQKQVSKDPETMPRMNLAGNAFAILPNRLSWYFDLLGPSIHIDTACSSSLVAADLACQSIRSGDSDAALVLGTNVILGPECSLLVSNLNFLSPDSLCYSFDHRANGYARGEGVISMLLKPVASAIRDGDMIRAVIRSTGSNQDGHTPILTQPSLEAQEKLIRHVYRKAKLDLVHTRYIEAHGTGTAVGDPIEVKAIGRVFRNSRTDEEPLYVGSIKSSIGHSEGCSGLAGILKAILVLEKGIIPPQALFESINPDIDESFYRVRIPKKSIRWPTNGLRRVSVNSFGFGGCNSHAILDDALSYLKDRQLQANHATSGSEVHRSNECATEDQFTGNGNHNGVNGSNGSDGVTFRRCSKRILVWSASDEKALQRVAEKHDAFVASSVARSPEIIDRLSYTLAARRSRFGWRMSAIVDTADNAYRHTGLPKAEGIRSSSDAGIALVFTGQGAQYMGMGSDLFSYSVFENALRRADEAFKDLGCSWSLFVELQNEKNIDKPQYSQPLTTAIQIGLIELFSSFGIKYRAVVGHSSGEVAAAYAIGALSLTSACKVSFFRGLLAGQLKDDTSATPGAMMSVNLARDDVEPYLAEKVPQNLAMALVVACVNSPTNCTLSGPESVLDDLKVRLEDDGIFAQKLRTGVAYHSPSVACLESRYVSRLGILEAGDTTNIPMVSSVTGQVVNPSQLSQAQYWADNMKHPVEFSKAMHTLTQKTETLKLGMEPITDLLEIGPHSALKRPVLDCLQHQAATESKSQKTRYFSALCRTKHPVDSVLELVGDLFCHGHEVDIPAANQQLSDGSPRPFLVNCPSYPFDRSRSYWREPRMSRDYRLRKSVAGDVLGECSPDWNHLEPRWRSFLSTETVPWTKDHVVNGTILYPAAGMLVMAMEAVRQMCPPNRTTAGYLVKKAQFLNPIVVKESSDERTEIVLQLRPVQSEYEKGATWFDIKIFTHAGTQFTKSFQGHIQVEYEDTSTEVDKGREKQLATEDVAKAYSKAEETCGRTLSSDSFYRDSEELGIRYGEWFHLLTNIRWDGDRTGIATVDISGGKHSTTSTVHPAVLDAALQALRATATKGLTDSSSTYVPTHVHDAWFSAQGWQHPETSSIQYLTTTTESGTEGTIHAISDSGRVLCTIGRLVCAAVASSTQDDTRDRKLLYGVEWKPHLSLLSPRQLQFECDAGIFQRDEPKSVEYFKKLNATLGNVMSRVLAQLAKTDHQIATGELQRYVVWMEKSVERLRNSGNLDESSQEELEMHLHELEELLPDWKIFPAISRKLKDIIVGDADPLDVVFGQNLAEGFYANLFKTTCDHRFRRLLELAAHENPCLRILEVGAGTGGVTGYVLSALEEMEQQTGSMKFSSYTYTDISPSFFENASRKWSFFSQRMTFKAFDLEKTGPQQGFEAGSYDLVIAGSVLHATVDLTRTIRIVREMLRPGGHLITLEATAPENIATNFASGVLPGWWLSKEDWRSFSPTITPDQWDVHLKSNGFSGVDVCLRDYESDICHLMSVLVTRAVAQPKNGTSGKAVLVVDGQTTSQNDVAAIFTKSLHLSNSYISETVKLSDIKNVALGLDDVVVSLIDVDSPALAKLPEEAFLAIKVLVKRAQNLLWINLASVEDDTYAHYSIMKGFLRGIASESADKKIVSLSVESQLDDYTALGDVVGQVFKAAFQDESAEREYVLRDSQICTGRAKREVVRDEMLSSFISPSVKSQPWLPGPPLELGVGQPGLLDTVQFVEDVAHSSNLAVDEIEIEAKAWGLGFRHVLQALGRLEDTEYGSDCAGVVTRVGSACDGSILPGDRVCMSSLGCMRTYPRASSKAVVKITDSMTFEAAASVIMCGMTAYHALIDVARLQKGEKILIHSASGGTGQMAVWLAKMQGAEIFATVGFDEKKQLLVDQFGLEEDHIFYSRNTSFARGIKRVTCGYGVDVVLNSLSGDTLRASWECMAPFGRFIELGRADIDSNASLPMASFAQNVSFAAIDLHHIMKSNPELESRLLKKVMELSFDGIIAPPTPLKIFPASEIPQAFRHMQSGTNSGRVVISLTHSDMVPRLALARPKWRFHENASYMVAGGLGGLGRAILLWMADRGAKHLVVPSRSGVSTSAAADTVAALKKRGVSIVTPICDVSETSQVESMIQECTQSMPPIKGCINAAMVLQDAVFDNMSHAQWELTINSKVHTTWNLHKFLPSDLDFFVNLASICGIMGSLGQSNYAAGCTYQDALARYRVSHGQRAVSIDVGWMRDIGIISETDLYQAHRKNARDLREVDGSTLLSLLGMYCDPELPVLSLDESQVLIGLATPADYLSKGESVPVILNRPLLAPFSQVIGDEASYAGSAQGTVEPSLLFIRASDKDERKEIVASALATKLARAISISPEDVEPGKALSDYGVDSLMAVELRNWFNKDFHANVAVFDIMGGTPISSIAELIVERSSVSENGG